MYILCFVCTARIKQQRWMVDIFRFVSSAVNSALVSLFASRAELLSLLLLFKGHLLVWLLCYMFVRRFSESLRERWWWWWWRLWWCSGCWLLEMKRRESTQTKQSQYIIGIPFSLCVKTWKSPFKEVTMNEAAVVVVVAAIVFHKHRVVHRSSTKKESLSHHHEPNFYT